MKRTYLSGLIVASALVASPVFAAEDLCAVNMQKLNDAKTTSMQLGAFFCRFGGAGGI